MDTSSHASMMKYGYTLIVDYMLAMAGRQALATNQSARLLELPCMHTQSGHRLPTKKACKEFQKNMNR